MTEPRTTAEPGAASARALWAVAGLALLLRAVEAAESSLWLDELHTLSHASQPTFALVAQKVGAEYHTPLFFAFVHLFGGFELGAWLRAIPIVSSVAMLWPLVAVARECGLSPRAGALAAWLYACLPYHVLYGTELRPYAWVGCFAVFAFLLSFSERRPVLVRLALFFLAILLGLLTHRLMALSLLALGGARLLARKPGSVPLWGMIASGALAVAGFLPWLLHFAREATEMRIGFHERSGGYEVSGRLASELVALPSRLFTPYMRELGGAWAPLAIAATAAFAAGAAAVLLLAWRGRRTVAPAPALRGLALFAALQFALTTAVAVWVWDRVPLQYYVPMAWTLPILLAAAAERVQAPRAARALCALLAAASLAMGAAFVGGKSREDMRAGVAAVRELAREAQAATGLEPVYSALLAQPFQFEHALPYRAYAKDLAPVEPDRVPKPGEPGFERPLIVLRRAAPLHLEEWLPITTGRRIAEERKVDRYLTAYWFAPAP